MTNVFLKYNPYTVESEIKIDGSPVQEPNKLYGLKNERLQVWVESLLRTLDEVCNDNEYRIEFYGTKFDYDDLMFCIQDYCKKVPEIHVEIDFTEAKGSESRFAELIELFNEMQNDCPFEDLKTEQIRENFRSAIGTDFEVSVIATMSSGKSTLINALLGRELMPSKNEACTATIAKIRDIDGKEDFSAEYRNRDGKLLGEFEKLTLQDMTKMNENLDTAFINIEGDIPNIDSEDIKLVLVDTPGPNNSRTEEHKNHTYRVIKEKTKPMVLYVLNGTQLQTNDDKELLTAVSHAMEIGGKQSKDRFLFAVNKIDQFDTDRESVQGALDNVREYLKKFGIENPNLFPTSAEMAKLIRMKQNHQELTAKQKKTLRDYDLFIEETELHLSEQATLSYENMRKVKALIQEAKEQGDEYQEALIHTGVPAVELAIDEYLKKYAYTAKIKTAVDTFKKKIEEKEMQSKLMDSIKDNEKERQKTNNQLKEVKRLLEEGKAGQEFREKIEQLDMTRETNYRIRKLRAKVSSALDFSSEQESMTILEVQKLLMKLNAAISLLQSDVKTELENIVQDVIVDNAQIFIEDYSKHVEKLISVGEYASDCKIQFLQKDIPNAQEMINQYKYTESVDTGEEEWVKNTSKRWYKPWTWFQEDGYYRTIYKDVEMVKWEDLFREYIQPVLKGFDENIRSAESEANRSAESFKRYFLKELDKLEKALTEKVSENEKLTRDQESIERKLMQDKTKMEWLEDFMKRLDGILEI